MESELDWISLDLLLARRTRYIFNMLSQLIYNMKVLRNPKYQLNHSILVYNTLLSATRAVYPRTKDTD